MTIEHSITPAYDICGRKRDGWTCTLPKGHARHENGGTPHVAVASHRRVCAVWFTGGPTQLVDPSSTTRSARTDVGNLS